MAAYQKQQEMMMMMLAEQSSTTTATPSCPTSDDEATDYFPSGLTDAPPGLASPKRLEAPPGLSKSDEDLRESLRTRGASVLFGMQMKAAQEKTSQAPRRRRRGRFEDERQQAKEQLQHERNVLQNLQSKGLSSPAQKVINHQSLDMKQLQLKEKALQQETLKLQQQLLHLHKLELLCRTHLLDQTVPQGPPGLPQAPGAAGIPAPGLLYTQMVSL
eukprot:TRINITY_DN66891_c0_g1_i1.p1 TRINITY_DN66891_c0_g1~~TRINITY_DN66891_c0_g1_i1.p1  ORF type:complete len:252 (-),score=69.03 TRINITY_DN66891_c0_g1_i1:13-660(-)